MGEPQVAIEFNTKSGHNNVLDPWVSANFHQLKWVGFRNNRKWWDIDNHWYCIMKLKQHGFAWKSCAQNLDAVEPQFSTMKMAVSACANPPFLHQVPRWSCLDQFQPIFKSNLWAASPQETPRLSAINTSSRYCSYCSCGMLYFPWRIHGAGIYANIRGYIDGIHGTPYIPAPWILWVLRCQIWCALKNPAIFVRWHSQSKFPRISHCHVSLLEGNKSNRAYHHILLTESGTDSMQATLR